MELFKDAVYEKLDDISQLVEPYEFNINSELAQMPDEIILGPDFFHSMIACGGGRDNVYESGRKVIERTAKRQGLSELGEWSRLNPDFCKEFFEILISKDAAYNPATKEMTGEVKITKKKMAYEDKEIDDMLISHMKQQFRSHLNRPSSVNKAQCNEICDLFGATDAMSDRKASGKIRKLTKRYQELLSDRTLNIRDVNLFKRFINWNIKYIKDGNLPAMSNITKLKIMMRSELPIYSIKEDEV